MTIHYLDADGIFLFSVNTLERGLQWAGANQIVKAQWTVHARKYIRTPPQEDLRPNRLNK